MGSTGSGRISDYPGSSSSGAAADIHEHATQDRCARAFNVRLEDAEHSEYYQKHGAFPPVGTQVQVAHRKRLVAQTTDGESIGNLPTSFNYLASCMKDGWVYVGVVQHVTSGPPVAIISVDFAPTTQP